MCHASIFTRSLTEAIIMNCKIKNVLCVKHWPWCNVKWSKHVCGKVSTNTIMHSMMSVTLLAYATHNTPWNLGHLRENTLVGPMRLAIYRLCVLCSRWAMSPMKKHTNTSQQNLGINTPATNDECDSRSMSDHMNDFWFPSLILIPRPCQRHSYTST